MKSRIKGVTHHESKVLKMAEGGAVPPSEGKYLMTVKRISRPKKEVLKTTRTADGGQQYVRNNDYKVAADAHDKYKNRVFKGEEINPKAASSLAKATYYAMDPDDKSGFPERMGKISEEGAEAQNAITRKRKSK